MKRIVIFFFIIGLILMMSTACVENTPATSVQDTPTVSPDLHTSSPESQETASPAAQEATASPETAVEQKKLDVTEYLPDANAKLTTKEYLGKETPTLVKYVFAVIEQSEDPTYRVSVFYADQPFYYTNYYVDDAGLWAQYSEEGSEKYLVLPANLEEGVEFISGQNACSVAQVNADFEMDGYHASDCVIVQCPSTAYSTDVYKVYQKGVGLIAEYIPYDSDEIDLLRVAQSVESITQEEVDAIIQDSMF